MKKALLYAPNDLRVDDVPEPAPPGPTEVIVHITNSSICYTDVKIVTGYHKMDYPGGFGHADVGSDVTRVKVGDRVVFGGSRNCGRCETCLEGHPNLCLELAKAPLIRGDAGWFVEYTKVDERALHVIPEGISQEAAAFMEPITTAFNTRRLIKYKAGDWVAVLGAGSMGWGQVVMAKATGAKVIAIDLVPSQLDMARRLGADETLNPKDESDMPAALERIIGPRGAKYMIETTNTEVGSQSAVKWVAIGGKVALHGAVGMINTFDIIPRALTIYGVRAGYQRAECLRMMAAGELDLTPAISHRMKLTDINAAFDLLTGPDHYTATKIVLEH
jgi:threonine dehydrogenase-like Zn-dependent dehydrogenase